MLMNAAYLMFILTKAASASSLLHIKSRKNSSSYLCCICKHEKSICDTWSEKERLNIKMYNFLNLDSIPAFLVLIQYDNLTI